MPIKYELKRSSGWGTEGVEEGFLHEHILCNLMAIICVDIATRIRIIQTGDENQILIPGSSSCRDLSIFRRRFVKLLLGDSIF